LLLGHKQLDKFDLYIVLNKVNYISNIFDEYIAINYIGSNNKPRHFFI